MLGDFASAIQFILLLVVTTVFGAAIFMYAAHVFVTVAQQTAGGLDAVEWPKDPWFDWIARALHLAWLVAFWLVPLGFVLRAVGPESLGASAALWVGVPAACFWLLFPVTLLSSFSAGSPWVLLRAEALGRMARCPAATLGFYLVSAPVCVLGAASLYVTLAERRFYALPALAVVLFVYPRLVGRYSRLLGRARVGGTRPKGDKGVRRAAKAAQVEDPRGPPAPATKTERPRKKRKRAAKAEDPWAVPEQEPAETKSAAPMVEGYGLADDQKAEPERREAQKRPRVKGYDVKPAEPPTAPQEVPLDGTPPIESSRIASEAERPLPDWPFVSGVFTFPWYPSNLGVWGLLTLLFLVWGLMYIGMQSLADRLLRQ
jgi:hypothetical protein